MANYGGQNYTTFSGVNIKSSAGIRFAADVAGNESTLGVRPSLDTARSWSFPDKSGTFPIMGTFNVQFPTITSTSNIFSTIVTVPGIRAEDALVVQLNRGISASYDVMAVGSGSTARVLNAVTPGNGNITLGFINMGLTTVYADLVYSYLAMR